MKVLLINSVVDYGSTGKITRDLANELKAKGHDVLIAFGRNTAKYDESIFNISNRLEFGWHFLMTRLFGRHGLHSSLATNKLINKIKEFNPDIVHLHNLHGYYLNVPKLMKFLKSVKGLKVVWTMHDMWAISGSSAHYSYAGCAEWDEGCVICNDPKEYPKSMFFDRQRKNFKWKKEVFSNFDDLTIVAVSDWQRLELEKSFFKQYKIVKIYNGLDLDLFIPNEEVNEPSDKVKLLGVSTDWRSRKGLDDFVELAELYNDDYEVTLVGLTQEQVETLPDSITKIERTSDFQELVKLYQDSDLYLNLSVEETMGLTTVEALASGTAVVVYDQTAVPEIIDETVGAVTPAGDINKLTQAINKTVKRNIPAQVCIDYAKEHYSKDEMMKKYFEVYGI